MNSASIERDFSELLNRRSGISVVRSFRGPASPAVPSATECEPMPGIIGNSAALMDVLAMVRTVAPTDATVLITGESGTGKELVAHALHDLSDRHSNGFITMNCAVFSKRAHRVIETIPSSTMHVLTLYIWPGNVRELKNLLERSVILSRGRVLEIPLRDVRICTAPVPVRVEESRTLEAVERAHIVSTLNRTGWVLSGPNGAAAILGVDPSKPRSSGIK